MEGTLLCSFFFNAIPYDVVLKGWFYCRAMLAGGKRLSPTVADSVDSLSAVCPVGMGSR